MHVYLLGHGRMCTSRTYPWRAHGGGGLKGLLPLQLRSDGEDEVEKHEHIAMLTAHLFPSPHRKIKPFKPREGRQLFRNVCSITK